MVLEKRYKECHVITYIILYFIFYFLAVGLFSFLKSEYLNNNLEEKNMNEGRRGEILFKERMEQKGYKVKDLTDNPEYWVKDIDFVCESPTTRLTKSFEVKYDTKINKTGNLFIEVINPRSMGNRGWYCFCEADCLSYIDAATSRIYIIEMKDLKEVMKKKHNFRYIITMDGSEGYLVPLTAIDYKELI